MNQNKSNVPVSVAEEPDELSYYRLTLLSFLRESHPDLADDESFVTTRSDQAAEAFSAAILATIVYHVLYFMQLKEHYFHQLLSILNHV